MGTPAPVAIDAAALALLDDYLQMGADERQAGLARLRAETPALHGRLLRLLAASALAEDSHFLAAPPLMPGLTAGAASEQRSAAFTAGALVGGYRLLRALGRGGMSVVWLAERADGVIKRAVAIKLPWLLLSPSNLGERFARERDVLAALSHPHIARLYDAGVADNGQPYIVLEAVDGHPITEHCDRAGLGIRARLDLFQQVLSAVGHAHKHLVVHRDVKPSNVLVDRDGQVKLLDFGIAKLLGSEPAGRAELTAQDGGALTPRYAAPEQLTRGAISTQTDVYALGLLLYELLCGQPAYGGPAQSMAGLSDAILHHDPVRPSRANADLVAAKARGLADPGRLQAALAGDLDTIVLKALRKRPADRYSSVERFADDLQRHVARLPISARPADFGYLLRLFVLRHRMAVISAGLAGGLALVFAALALQQHLQSRLQAARALAVSGFLSDMLSDAEADESHAGHEVTGKEMVDAAVGRARQAFKGRDQLQGELLGELGRMYYRLGEGAKSLQVLGEARSLLEPSAPADDPALNKVRAHLAAQWLNAGQPARAQALALQAHAACSSSDTECAKARAYANHALALIENQAGHAEAALAYARATLQEMTRGFGPNDSNVQDALESLAMAARNAGQLEEARQALARALEIGQTSTLRDADRLRLERTQALLALDMGQFASAAAQLAGLLPRLPVSVERAIVLRLQSNALAALGDADGAWQAAEQAVLMSRADKPQAAWAFALLARARALSLQGRHAQALADLQAASAALGMLGYAADTVEVLRAGRLRAEAMLRAGQTEPARQALEAGVAQLTALTSAGPRRPAHEAELAQTLDLLGCVLARAGDVKTAGARHGQARIWLQKNLPADHPFMDRNALYRVAATALEQGTSAARDDWAQRARAYQARFPPSSLWHVWLSPAADPSACTGRLDPSCLPVL